MSNIIKCENCGCEGIDIIHKYKGYYGCPKCGRDTERLYEIEHDKEIRVKAIDEMLEELQEVIDEHGERYVMMYMKEIAEQMKAGGIDE